MSETTRGELIRKKNAAEAQLRLVKQAIREAAVKFGMTGKPMPEHDYSKLLETKDRLAGLAQEYQLRLTRVKPSTKNLPIEFMHAAELYLDAKTYGYIKDLAFARILQKDREGTGG